MAEAADLVRDLCVTRGIDAATLTSLLRHRDAIELVDAADHCFDRTVPAPRARMMRGLVAVVEDVLCLDEPVPVVLASRVDRVVGVTRAVFSGGLFLACLWLVVGGIVTGQTLMAQHTSVPTTLAVLLLSLGVLALLEAAHIGAVALADADVSELRESYPRVHRLHRHIATKERLEHYLAGRQTGVVLVVFAVAEVTRTAGASTVPGTDVALPAWMGVVLALGVPGAVTVLIVAQVAPQLIAARRPAALMNTVAMHAAFMATVHISRLGLAAPATWLVAWAGEAEHLPSAAAGRHAAMTRDVTGFGTDIVRRQTHVGPAGTRSTTVTSTCFHRDGVASHAVDIATTPRPPRSSAVRAYVASGERCDPVVVVAAETSAIDDHGTHLFSETFAPRLGVFGSGDVLRTSFAADYAVALDEDVVLVTTPTRLVVLRVVLEHPTTPLPPARLSIAVPGSSTDLEVRWVTPRMNELDGSVELLAEVRYPAPGSEIRLAWGTEQVR